MTICNLLGYETIMAWRIVYDIELFIYLSGCPANSAPSTMDHTFMMRAYPDLSVKVYQVNALKLTCILSHIRVLCIKAAHSNECTDNTPNRSKNGHAPQSTVVCY